MIFRLYVIDSLLRKLHFVVRLYNKCPQKALAGILSFFTENLTRPECSSPGVISGWFVKERRLCQKSEKRLLICMKQQKHACSMAPVQKIQERRSKLVFLE